MPAVNGTSRLSEWAHCHCKLFLVPVKALGKRPAANPLLPRNYLHPRKLHPDADQHFENWSKVMYDILEEGITTFINIPNLHVGEQFTFEGEKIVNNKSDYDATAAEEDEDVQNVAQV